MSKSILVFDTPESCIDCPCCFADNTMIWCGKQHEVLCEPMTHPEWIEKFKPDWCPLRDLPEKKDMEPGKTIIRAAQYEGWNMCIDEILKGANGNE